MARSKGTSRITAPGTVPGRTGPVVVASFAMVVPMVAGLIQALV